MAHMIMTKGYLPKLALFLAALLLLDWFIYKSLFVVFERVETGNRTGGIINKARRVKAEVVVIGNSRASHHYDSRIFEKGLQTTVFNAGCDGQGIPYIRALINLLMLDYTPRLLIINLDPESIDVKAGMDVNLLTPFMNESNVIRNMVLHRSKLEFIKHFSKSYIYNGKILPIFGQLFKKDNSKAGFVPLLKTADQAILDIRAGKQNDIIRTKDPYLMKLLEEAIDEAKSRGTKVFLVTGPRWIPGFAQSPTNARLQDAITNLALNKSVPYFVVDQLNSPEFQNASLFYDTSHLNQRGAATFTKILLDILKQSGALRETDLMKREQIPNI